MTKIISTARMGNGTLQAKFMPLSKVEQVKKIYILRKEKGPEIDKVKYIVLPKVCKNSVGNLLIAPFFLIFYSFKLKVDIILAYHLVPHAFFAFIASIVTRRPFIFAQTGGQSQILFQKLIWKFFIKKVFKRASYIFVPGNEAKSFWEENTIFKEKIKILHSTINVNRFKPNPEIKKDIDILYVGVLRPRKQVDVIIRAFKELLKVKPSAHLGIVGTGIMENDLKDLVNELNIEGSVTFYGFQINVLPFLQRAKIFIMASIMEGLPVALMEAMACELSVIAPEVDNIPTVLINKKTGYLMKSTTQDEVNNTLLNAYRNYNKDMAIRKSARKKIINEYSYDNAIDKWGKIITTIN